ncbi:hypothetical protein L7F22_048872 [Adiantum nelumboides]|nr:hypothetical protein [Adiantum nelumboides]
MLLKMTHPYLSKLAFDNLWHMKHGLDHCVVSVLFKPSNILAQTQSVMGTGSAQRGEMVCPAKERVCERVQGCMASAEHGSGFHDVSSGRVFVSPRRQVTSTTKPPWILWTVYQKKIFSPLFNLPSFLALRSRVISSLSLSSILWVNSSDLFSDSIFCVLVSFLQFVKSLVTGSEPSAGTQGSATQDPHIAASDFSFDFDVMEGYPMQKHPGSSSQDMHALGQQPGVSMFSRLKETLSRATCSEHATNEINEGGGEVNSPFNSQIDPVLAESVHVSTPTTTPIGLSKLTSSETLLPDGRSLAEVQEVERYILAARKKEIESLRKTEHHRVILTKAPMTSANPLQTLELKTLKNQPIQNHIASGSKEIPNTSILNGVFLNENWKYNRQTEKLTDLYTSYTYHVDWLNVIQATSNSTSVNEQQRIICDVIHSIVQMERQNLGINMPSMGPMRFLDTTKAKQPTISQMETPSVSPMDPSYIVSPGVSM